MDSFRINSKDLKAQAKLLKEDHTIVNMGKDNNLLKREASSNI